MSTEYTKARKLGEKEYKKLVSQGLSPFVPALDRLLPGLDTLKREPIGICEIPLDMIVGTVTAGRTDAFSPSFLPLIKEDSEFAAKWSSLYRYQLTSGITDAIKVYEYRRGFYVLEGNKRVSVMRYLGAPTIAADVYRILAPAGNDEESRVYQEFVRFHKVTGLYEIGLSHPGNYETLATLLGRDLDVPWPEDLVDTLRAAYTHFLQLLDRRAFQDPERSPGDIFLSYLSYYPPQTLLFDGDDALARRFERIRKEFRTEGNKANIAYVESPDQSLEKDLQSGPSVKFRELLTKTISSRYSEAHPLRVAFLHTQTPQVSSRVHSHELGRKHLSERFGKLVETWAYYDCLHTAGEAGDRLTFDRFDRAIDDAIAKGCEVIFTTSPALLPRVKVAALQHPEVKFLNCSVNLSHMSIRCYDSRMYEVKFMMGALAACFAENHQIGYLAGTPTYGTIANINAFAIGASMADPYAKVLVAWRAQKDADWYAQMQEAGISVFSDVDFVSAEDGPRPYGLYAYKPDGGIQPLARPLWNWGRYYELIALSLLRGTYDIPALEKKDRALNYWLGLSAGVVDILPDPDLPYATRNLLDMMRSSFLAGSMTPFGGELHSQDGIIRYAGDPPLTRQEILTMDWLNENVVGSIPDTGALDIFAQSVAAVSGVTRPTSSPRKETP